MMFLLKVYEYEDGTICTINNDNSISVKDDYGKDYTISGFSSLENAKTFLTIGDLELDSDNDYFLFTNSKERLEIVF